MRWFLFLFCITICFCCRNKQKQSATVLPEERKLTYNDTARMPWGIHLEDDTGYFKGHVAEPLTRFESLEGNHLYTQLAALVQQKDIQLLDSETLSNSVFIDPIKHIRRDTMRNKHSVLISEIQTGKGKKQKASLNGKVFLEFDWDGTEADEEDYGPLMQFDAASFRHFSFHGQSYYCIQANEAYMLGSSAANVTYYYILDESVQVIGLFQTCRFAKMLAGDADEDTRLDFLEFDNSDFCTTIPSSNQVTIRIWSADTVGNMRLQKDAAGLPWTIEAHTGEDRAQDSLILIRTHWPVMLK